MNSTLSILQNAIHDTLVSPAQNPSQTLLLASIALIILLIAVLTLLMLITPRRRKVVKIRRYRTRPGVDDGYYHPDSQNPDVPAEVAAERTIAPAGADAPQARSSKPVVTRGAAGAAQPKRRMSRRTARMFRIAGTWGVAALMVGSLVVGYWITGTNAYCAKTCHVNEDFVQHAGTLDHASCVACHEGRGLASVPVNLAQRTAMVVARFQGRTSSGAVVSSQNCLGCHSNVAKDISTSATGVKMSHAAPIAVGMTCTSCHSQVGHGRPTLVTMSDCVVCHDNKTASAECLTCHSTQPLAAVAKSSSATTSTIGSGNIPYPLVDVQPRQCGACHNQPKECDTCHGLRMPHTDAFINGGHAVAASFDGRTLCLKCHDRATDCGFCHIASSAHPSNWKTAHATYPWNSGCACHHQAQGSGCYVCHEQAAPHTLRR